MTRALTLDEAYRRLIDAGRYPASEHYAAQFLASFEGKECRPPPCSHEETGYCIICEAEKLPEPEPQSWE